MAQTSDINSSNQNNPENSDVIQLEADNSGKINLPEGNFVGDSELSRDGQDLNLEFSNGDNFTVENYFSDQNDYLIQDSSGGVLTQDLTNSFIQSSPEYAQNNTMTDESPVGAVEEIKGNATITHADGSTDEATLGSPIYQGDIIQTSGDGAVNIVFIDETSMAISDNARIAVDNYQFDAATESGETDFSVLRGVFVYTSGLIGRDDPDDVEINTPVGSIGIRGTIIAGNINPEGQSEISVLEGAIVIKNGAGEITLSQQYETVKLGGFADAIEYKGVEAANDIGETYGSVSDVLPKLFSSINDATEEEIKAQEQEVEEEAQEEIEAAEEKVEEQIPEEQEVIDEPKLEDINNDAEFNSSEETIIDKDIADKPPLDRSSTEIKDKPPLPQDRIEDPLYQEAKDFTEEPQIIHNFRPVFEGAKEGSIVGIITLKNYPIGTALDFSTVPANYIINPIAGTNKFEIRLTSAGETIASTGSIGTPLETLDLVVTLANGDQINLPTHTPQIMDAVVNVNSPGGLNYGVQNGTALPNGIKVGDFDGNGTKDFAHINGGGDVIANGSVVAAGNYSSIASVGDINNDGYADIIAGDLSSPNGATTLIDNSGATASGSGANVGDQYGTSVAGIGDFDGDGKSDYIVGAPGVSGGNGKSYIELGNGSSYYIASTTTGENLGQNVAGIGDVNGDGFSDILISGNGTTGDAYVIFGNTAPGDIVDVNSLGANGFKIEAGIPIVTGGSVGDINGDGLDDFAISLQDGSAVNTYVIYGHDGAQSNYNLADLENPDNALKVHHAGADGGSYQVTALGDVNGDGFDDFQLGDGGQQFIIQGQAGDNVVTDNSAHDADGNAGAIRASSGGKLLAGDVDFNDGTFSNTSMKGGGSNNTFEINNSNFNRIDGGAGFDTIQVVQGGATLDFTGINFEQISQIEAINFGNTGQTITLTAENIFNMLKSSDNGELRISGAGILNIDANVATNVTGALNEQGSGATYTGTETLDDGNNYWSYNVGGYDLYIEDTMTAINIV